MKTKPKSEFDQALDEIYSQAFIKEIKSRSSIMILTRDIKVIFNAGRRVERRKRK